METIREALNWSCVWICSVTSASFVDRDIIPPQKKGLLIRPSSRIIDKCDKIMAGKSEGTHL